ncbi:MAG: phytanoyl-CoA dioxygenase family protein [Alphaproteobacteria bacterium]
MLANTNRVLNEEQREQWAVDGYLHLEAALSPAEVAFFSDEIDRVRMLPGYEPAPGKLPRGHYDWVEHANPDLEAFMDRRDLLPYHQAFIDLIDRPAVFDLILDLMGPYIQFSMSQAIVRAAGDGFPGYTHTDGGEGQRGIRVTETSRPLAVKVMYLLTDVTEPDSGNFTLFPGSHLRPYPDRPERIPHPHAPGAVQLMGKAGDAYVFPHAIWHGPSPNRSNTSRKTILYNYTQMFMRAYDFGAPYQALFDRCTPRQRRLLGDLGHDFRPGDFFYVPEDQEQVMAGDGPIAERPAFWGEVAPR